MFREWKSTIPLLLSIVALFSSVSSKGKSNRQKWAQIQKNADFLTQFTHN
jgi:hypothetical protein